MEMFLMGLALSLLGVAVSTVLFAAATHDVREAERAARPGVPAIAEAPAFFVHQGGRVDAARPTQVPIEVLLLQIERHVRLEQAAAESFHLYPTAEALHVTTMSPLVH